VQRNSSGGPADEADSVRELGLVELDQATEPRVYAQVAGFGFDQIEENLDGRKPVFRDGCC